MKRKILSLNTDTRSDEEKDKDYTEWSSKIVPNLVKFHVIDNLEDLTQHWEKLYKFICHYMPYSPSELDQLEMKRFFAVMDEAEETHKKQPK